MFPYSFIISLIWVISFFLLFSWAKGLTVMFIFSNNQLLNSLILYVVFIVSISLISSLIFIMSCYLLDFHLVCIYVFLNLLVVSLSYFFWFFNVSLMAINLLFRTSFNVFQMFCYVIFSFSLTYKNIFISVLKFSWGIHHLVINCSILIDLYTY